MRQWSRVKLATTALLMSLLGLGYTLFFTQPGAQWLVNRAIGQFPGQLRIQQVEGTLWHGLTLQTISLATSSLTLKAERIGWRWQPGALIKSKLHIQTLAIDNLQITLVSDRNSAEQPSSAPLTIPLMLQLDELAIHGGFIEQAQTRWPLTQLTGELTLQQERLHLARVRLVSDQAEAELDGSIGLNSPHTLAARLNWLANVPELGKIDGSTSVEGDLQQINLSHTTTLPFAVNSRGTVDLVSAQPQLKLEGEWQGLHWPINGPVKISSQRGSYKINGPFTGLDLVVNGEFSHPELASSQFHFIGQLQDNLQLDIDQLLVRLLGGELTLSGNIELDEQTPFQLTLKGKELNPGSLDSAWPGKLALEARLDGRIIDGVPELDGTISSISGTLRGYPLLLQGGLGFHKQQLTLSALNLHSGPNQLQLTGAAWPRFDINLQLDMPRLEILLPELKGQTKGSARLTGTAENPALTGKFSGQDLVYGENTLARFEADLQWHPGADEQAESNIRLEELQTPSGRWENGHLLLRGTPESHRLESALQGTPFTATLQANGSLQNGSWKGTLDVVQIEPDGFGAWRNEQPARLQLGTTDMQLDPICLKRQQASVCTRLQWQPNTGVASQLTLEEIDFSLLQPLLPGHLQIEGALNGEVTITGQTDALNAQASLIPGAGIIHFPGSGDPPLQIAFADAQAHLTYAADRLQASAQLALPQRGQARLELTIEPPNAQQQRAILGSAEASFPTLDLLTGFIPQARIHQGQLTLESRVTGTLQQPQIQGEFRLSNGIIDIAELGIRLEELELSARNRNDNVLDLAGTARSGEGAVKLSGEVQLLPEQDWPFNLAINGSDFQLLRLPEAQATASPALTLKGHANQMSLSGSLLLPQVNVVLRELPAGTIAVSEDEIIITERVVTPPPRAKTKLTGEVNLLLGDQVMFKGFGLSTRLDGKIAVKLLEERRTEAHGNIQLHDGKYKAYGQNLTIERGELLFSGPTNNPYMEVHAVRPSQDGKVKAYLQISGAIKKPGSRIYSQPELPESETLAYLLTGRPLDAGTSDNTALMLQAATNLGLEQTLPVLRALQQQTGLDELTIKTGSGTDSAALVGGKYLNPDLYLSYVQGLFDPQGTLSVKYRLSDKLSIETRSGSAQSVDIIYNLERD